MIRPSQAERTVDPFSKDLVTAARMLQEEGRKVTIDILLAKEAIEQGRKEEIVRRLREYGCVEPYEGMSRLVNLAPDNMASVKRLEDDYYDDHLPGVEMLEVDTVASLCGRGYDCIGAGPYK